jgi:large subunit ribosomal protein L32
MAVPKKKMSKSRKNARKNTWKKKILKQVQLALTIGNSIFNPNSNLLFS